MSLYGIMRTGVSGMNAQANRLSTVAENVANVNTTGYKTASCEFSSLLLSTCPADYESGSVLTNVRNHIDQQGSLAGTSSVTDLAISGTGFFVVEDEGGMPFLTRAGNFVPDGDGALVNAAGFGLLGYRLDPDQPAVTLNGFSGLSSVTMEDLELSAAPSTAGSITANLPADSSPVAAGSLPSVNGAGTAYTAKSSLITYDNLGGEVKLDLFFTKTDEHAWELAVFDADDAGASGGFPYASAPLSVRTLSFDAADGHFSIDQSPALDIDIPDGRNLSLDLTGLTQLSAGFTVLSAEVNGNPPTGADLLDIAEDGLVYATYGSGARVPVYRIPLAHVASPDMLTPLAGNVYAVSSESGNIEIGFAESGSLGQVISGALEQSTVDLASELTAMIDAQRGYTANSKVFQTGSELMDVLVNLKR